MSNPRRIPVADAERARPLAVDLFCGLGGWTEGLLAEGYYVVGFDITRHVYGEHRYPAQLVLQNVMTLHGSQFKDAALIVASPPCQDYSYRAMPWKRAKALPPPDNSLFDACFRIQREAIAAAGHFIPLVVENVRGAQPWVGHSRWNYGSFHFWGDVPALMPMVRRGPLKHGVAHRSDVSTNFHQGKYDKSTKNEGGSWFAISHNKVQHNRGDDIKCGGDWFGSGTHSSSMRHQSSRSLKRKMTSALIAKIPYAVSTHIARVYFPRAPAARAGRECCGGTAEV